MLLEARELAPHLDRLGLQLDQPGLLPELAQHLQARGLGARRPGGATPISSIASNSAAYGKPPPKRSQA
jgi:hypothetical protein